MKHSFSVGEWLLFCGRNAKVLALNADGTYNIEYWMGTVGKSAKILCSNVKESNLKKERFS
jgi:hypothetical protein